MKQRSFPCVVMRGGTSRGLFFLEQHLPQERAARDRVMMAAIGGPDPRQVDGLGGADLLLSKVAIVGASGQGETDVNCTFVSVTPGKKTVTYGANCGNLISAVALLAMQEGLAAPAQPETLVRMYNTNSGAVVEGRVRNIEDPASAEQTCKLTGMPATGSWVDLDFLRPAGTVQERLLPTGNATDRIELPDGRSVRVSVVDAGALYAFVPAEELGLSSAATSAEVQGDAGLMATLERVRGSAAALAGLVDSPEEALQKTPAVPKLAFVGPPAQYQLEGHDTFVDADAVDLLSRIISCQQFHKAYAVTGAIATATAAVVPGSIVQQLTGLQPEAELRSVRIGHPTGVLECSVQCSAAEGGLDIERARLARTARRIMEGLVFASDAS